MAIKREILTIDSWNPINVNLKTAAHFGGRRGDGENLGTGGGGGAGMGSTIYVGNGSVNCVGVVFENNTAAGGKGGENSIHVSLLEDKPVRGKGAISMGAMADTQATTWVMVEREESRLA